MQWKVVLFSILVSSPLASFAQGPRVNLNTDGRKIAMNNDNNDGVRKPVNMDSVAPKAMPFTLDGNDKVIKITGSEPKKKYLCQPVFPK